MWQNRGQGGRRRCEELRPPAAGTRPLTGSSATRAGGYSGALRVSGLRWQLAKLGEDITETLEIVPRQWKVIQTVREKFSCRSCEKITQPPAAAPTAFPVAIDVPPQASSCLPS
jgi:zinc-finger binding domain of transposase IS66